MEIKRSDALVMFKDLGYKTCDKWENDRLERKLNKLPELIDGTPDIPTSIIENSEHLCNKICKSVQNEEKIKIIDDEGDTIMAKKSEKKTVKMVSLAEYEGRAEPKKKATKERSVEKKTMAKKIPGEKKERKSSVGKNKYGYRLGTKSDAVDSVLGKKPLTVKEIAEKSKQDAQFVRMHLTHAVDHDRGVKKIDDGFVSVL